jgi:hypothetical protein
MQFQSTPKPGPESTETASRTGDRVDAAVVALQTAKLAGRTGRGWVHQPGPPCQRGRHDGTRRSPTRTVTRERGCHAQRVFFYSAIIS